MAVVRVQYKHVYIGQSGTFDSNITANNTVIVALSWNGTGIGSQNPTLSDNLGNTWTLLEDVSASTGFTRLRVWYSVITTGGSCTLTMTDSLMDPGFTATEYSGLPSAGLVVTHANATGKLDPIQVSLTGYKGGLVWGGYANESNYTALTANSGFTKYAEDTSHWDAQQDQYPLPSTGTYTPGFDVGTTYFNEAFVGVALGANTTTSTSSSTSSTSSSTSLSTSTSISTSSTSSSTSTSVSTSTSSTSSSTSTSTSTSSTSSSTSTTQSLTTSTSSTSSSISTSTSTSTSTSSTSSSTSTSTSTTSQSTSSSTSMSTSTTQSFTTSTSSTSTSSTSVSTSSTTTLPPDEFIPTLKNPNRDMGIVQAKATPNRFIDDGSPDVLVDDTAYLVDDPVALAGGQKVASGPIFIK